MSTHFDPVRGLIIVHALLSGPHRDSVARLALDTGAVGSMISWDLALLLGYDPAASRDRVQLTTASGVEYAPRFLVESVEAFGKVRRDFRFVCHTLPTSTGVDGLLGLDFLRGCRLDIDFRTGTIEMD